MRNILLRMGRPKKSEPSEPLRIPQSVVRKLRRNALHRGKDPGDYAAELLLLPLESADKEMLLDLQRERATNVEKPAAKKNKK